jgi:hypothetical protein
MEKQEVGTSGIEENKRSCYVCGKKGVYKNRCDHSTVTQLKLSREDFDTPSSEEAEKLVQSISDFLQSHFGTYKISNEDLLDGGIEDFFVVRGIIYLHQTFSNHEINLNWVRIQICKFVQKEMKKLISSQ